MRAAFVFAIENGKITRIDLVMDPHNLGQLEMKMG